MGKIFLCSDWHFNHNQPFIWQARGFTSVNEMNMVIIARHNSVVSPDDDVYVLGDLMLGKDDGSNLIELMNGKLHIILGNHDSPAKIEKYKKLSNVVEICWATGFRYRKYFFYLSHYPTITTNPDDNKSLHQKIINIFGHTHSNEIFYNNISYMYNVAMEAHDCFPVDIDEAIEQMKEKFKAEKS